MYVCYNWIPHHEQVARELLKAGANLDAQEKQGGTALIAACQNGHTEVGSCFFDPTQHAHAYIITFVYFM